MDTHYSRHLPTECPADLHRLFLCIVFCSIYRVNLNLPVARAPYGIEAQLVGKKKQNNRMFHDRSFHLCNFNRFHAGHNFKPAFNAA